MELSRTLGLILRVYWTLAGLALVAFVAHVALGVGSDRVFDDFVYNGLMAAAAAACLGRAALVPAERLAWAVMGIGLVAWTGGEVYWTLVLADLAEVPVPSLADALYLAYYVASYVTLVLLLRSRVGTFRSSLWLDGAIGALAVSAFAVAIAFQPIVDATQGASIAVAVNLAYPLGDLALLSLVVAIFGVSGWRPSRAFLLVGCGLGLSAVADGIYLFQSATGSYSEGTLLDPLWPAAALLVGLAAWQPAKLGGVPSIEGWRVVAVPFACGLAAVGLLAYDHVAPISDLAVVLASASALLVIVRMALVFVEHQSMLSHSRSEALTDALTGLRNRRGLMADLERELSQATPASPGALVLFDLDGFKEYNDTFGHPAGDELLARLGARLADAVRGHGLSYRLGGDEFCVLVAPGPAGVESVQAACVAALSERGDGFEIDASHGAALVPGDAKLPVEALQIADRRMYARKGGRRMSAGRQSRDVLLRTLCERQPDLHIHLRDVAALALMVGRELRMGAEELDELARAAELHDVGKIAIPDAILGKAGPLEPSEWSFMHRHTIIGERILLAAPALRPVARLVRSSHERWDGCGYPDGLAGDDIPLGARIVAVCDAFNAMTTDRPYRPRMSPEGALAELRSCAGTQFDPRVVEAFCRTYARMRPVGESAATPA